ncbi:MAG TPA: alcohol dehydrogenase catalytic domain-containing protein [Firmicutes bacterium]|nr:alcohol dehydrogenase catalytic domain-containing protein [Bacillota bacterium]
MLASQGRTAQWLYRAARVVTPGSIELVEVPIRRLGPGDVLIRVHAAAISGSDIDIYTGKASTIALPSAIGHELSGEVVETGGRASRFAPGDMVVVESLIPCEGCQQCLVGAFNKCKSLTFGYRTGMGGIAEYYIANEKRVHRLPNQLSCLEGSLVEPAAVAAHAVRKSGVTFGDRVAIFGASAVGLLVLQFCKAAGAGEVYVVDTRSDWLALAASLGADQILDCALEDAAQTILELTGGVGVERCFEISGSPETLRSGLESLAQGGVLTITDIGDETCFSEILASSLRRRELIVQGSYYYCGEFPLVLEMLARGRIRLERLISHVVDFEHVNEAFKLAVDPTERAVKVILSL